MPRRSNNFQNLVEMLERQLAPTGAKVIGSHLLEDARTGDKREVDIVIETSAGIHPVVIGIEVVDQNRRASSPWVEYISAKHADLPIDKTILVSRSGFYKPALAKAESLKMDALTLEDATNLDWNSKIDKLKTIKIESFLVPYATKAKLILQEDNDQRFRAEIAACTNLSAVEIFKPNGDSSGTVGSILDQFLANEELIKAAEKIAFTDGGTILEGGFQFVKESYIVGSDGNRHIVLGCNFRAKCRKEVKEITLDKGRYRETSVALGSGTSFGNPVQIAFSENRDDESPMIGIRIERSRSRKGDK